MKAGRGLFFVPGDIARADALRRGLRGRLANRVQLTTDGAYLSAVEEAFGADVDYAMLVKLYGEPPVSHEPSRR